MAEPTQLERPDHARPRVGVSSCLMGAHVRFDGGDKRDEFLTTVLARFVDFVPVCPEVELGLGVPREPVRLMRASAGGRDRLIGLASGTDYGAAMREFAERRVAELDNDELCGYVLKQDSPSCGVERVWRYSPRGTRARTGRGLFADALLRRYPNLPMIEEGWLDDPRLRDNFLESVYAYDRLRRFFVYGWGVEELIAFHSAQKLQLMAHSRSYRGLDRIVADARTIAHEELPARYGREFMNALAHPVTPARHINVLQHIVGYFRDGSATECRRELLQSIENYRQGLVPLKFVLTMMREYAGAYGIDHLQNQTYLEPFPDELRFDNHL